MYIQVWLYTSDIILYILTDRKMNVVKTSQCDLYQPTTWYTHTDRQTDTQTHRHISFKKG